MINVEVAGSSWLLDPSSSRIYPIFKTNQIVDFQGTERNKFPLRDITLSQLKKFTKGLRISVSGLYFVNKDDKFKIVEACPACGGKVGKDKGMLCCNSELCTGKPFKALYNLLSICRVEDIPLEKIKNYLTIFPVGTENFSNVLNVVEKEHGLLTYLTLFKQLPKKSIPARYDLLVKVFGEFGIELWNMECELERKIDIGFSNQEFWWLLNLPGVTDVVAANLDKLDPTDFLKAVNEEDVDRIKTLFDRTELDIGCRAALLTFKPYWAQVLNVLKAFKKS